MPRLTKKRKAFADKYLETGNGTQSVLASHDTDNPRTASVMAVEILANPSVQQYLEDNARDAASRIVTLSVSAENETVKLNANKDILDRAGYKAVDKSFSLNLSGSLSAQNPKALALAEEYEQRIRNELTA